MSAPAATDASAPKPKGKKMIVIVGAVVLLLAVAAGAWMFLGRGHEEAEEDGAPASKVAHAKPKEGTPPVFLPLENMVVNLADAGGSKFAQVGVTVETMDQKTADQVKAYLPTIRNSVLMLVSQRTSEELLTREGKEKLATDIHREVSRPLGYEVEEAEPPETSGKARKKARAPAFNPVHGVLFSSFIIQ